MNPLRWKREYQVSCVAFCVVDGMAGLFFAWVDSLGHKLVITNAGGYGAQAWFFVWLTHPSQYWQWPLLGVVFVGLTFYAVMSVAAQSK